MGKYDEGAKAIKSGYGALSGLIERFNKLRSGDVRELTESEKIAQNVLDLLKSDKADMVTDEMLELADDVYLYKNYDLPMDEARRKAGADEMGFNVEGYHGTDKNFQSFIPSDKGLIGPGVYVTPETSLANKFATGPRDKYETVFEFMGDYYPENSRILPLLGTNKPASLKIKEKALDARRKAGIGPEGTKAFNRELGKYDGISVERQRTYADPKNLRSKFARFDPRLKHLKNLLASVAPIATAGALSQIKGRPE